MDKEQEQMRRSIKPPTIQKTQTPLPKPPPRINQRPPQPQKFAPPLSIPGLDSRFKFITSDI